MDSFAVIQPSVIGELFKPEQPVRSDKLVGNSYFHQIILQANELTQEVRCNWKEMPEEKRQILRSLATAGYDLGSPKKKQSFNLESLILRWKMAIVVLKGQQDVLFSATCATYRLMGAVMEVVEQEERNASMATVYLKNGETAEVPASEVENYLQANAEKLEPRIIKTRGPRRQLV